MQLLIALSAYRAGIVWIAPSYLLRPYLGRILTGLIYLAIAWVFVSLVDVVTKKLLAAMSGRQRTTVASIMPLTRRTLKVIAIFIAILATLSSWGYDTTALLAGLGVGGLAVALAAQKTIENLFGGIAVTTDKPVLVGDFCKYGDKVGVVEDIGLRSTRIRTLDRTVVTVPNGGLFIAADREFRSSRQDVVPSDTATPSRYYTRTTAVDIAQDAAATFKPSQNRAHAACTLSCHRTSVVGCGNLLICANGQL